MESKTKNRKSKEEIKEMVKRAFEVDVSKDEDAITEINEGWFNAIYDIKLSNGSKVILKIAPKKDVEVMQYEKNIMATEVSIMNLVGRNPKIPVPKIYFYDNKHDLCDSDYFFMEKINGENLHNLRNKLSPEELTKIDIQIGEIIREINSFTGSYFGYDGNLDLCANTWKEAFIKIFNSILEDGRRKNVVYDYSYDEILSILFKHVDSLEEVTEPRLVHWDAWDLNFFVKDEKIVGIIDFERALWGDPLMEAQFRFLSFGMGINKSMEGYGKTSFTNKELQRCFLYTLHLGLIMVTETFYRNYDTDEVLNIGKQLMHLAIEWLKEN